MEGIAEVNKLRTLEPEGHEMSYLGQVDCRAVCIYFTCAVYQGQPRAPQPQKCTLWCLQYRYFKTCELFTHLHQVGHRTSQVEA